MVFRIFHVFFHDSAAPCRPILSLKSTPSGSPERSPQTRSSPPQTSSCAQVPGALDVVPGAPFGPRGPARTFSGALLPPRGGVVKKVVLPGNPVFGPGTAEKSYVCFLINGVFGGGPPGTLKTVRRTRTLTTSRGGSRPRRGAIRAVPRPPRGAQEA